MGFPLDVRLLVVTHALRLGSSSSSVRGSCRTLADDVCSITTGLTLQTSFQDSGEAAPAGASPGVLQLPAAALHKCLRLHKLDCSHGMGWQITSLSGCPSWLQQLDCSGTVVSSLEPLAACTSLRELKCSGTAVSDAGSMHSTAGAGLQAHRVF